MRLAPNLRHSVHRDGDIAYAPNPVKKLRHKVVACLRVLRMRHENRRTYDGLRTSLSHQAMADEMLNESHDCGSSQLSLWGCVCHPQHLDKYSRKEKTRIRRDYLLQGILCLQTQDSSSEGSQPRKKLRNKVVACLRVLMWLRSRSITHMYIRQDNFRERLKLLCSRDCRCNS